MDMYFKMVTLFTFFVVLLMFGLLFYDSNRTLTIVILVAGLIIALIVILSELYFKRQYVSPPFLPQNSKEQE